MNPSKTLYLFVLLLIATTPLFAGKPAAQPTCPVPVTNPTINACSGSHGCLDNTFGNGGLVLTNPNGYSDMIDAVLQQLDGKLVAVGSSSLSNLQGIALVRYNTDGSVDTSFGTEGTTRFFPPTTAPTTSHGALFDSLGNILAVIDENGTTVVARFTPNGVLDTSYNSIGYVTYASVKTLGYALQTDGKLVLAGPGFIPGNGNNVTMVGLVTRLNSDGTLDSTFGSGGKVVLRSLSTARGLALQTVSSQQYIVVGGQSTGGDTALMRLQPSGAVDSSFGSSGLTTVSVCGQGSNADPVAIDNSGNILVAAAVHLVSSGPPKTAVMRFTPSGKVDTTFGDLSGAARTGRTILDVFGDNTQMYSIKFNSIDQTILVGGNATIPTGSFTHDQYLVTARYFATGALDTSYGSKGLTAADFGVHQTWVLGPAPDALLLQTDGRIVIGGGTSASGYSFSLARYLP
jgi:uncharacterized delta-60 repeat protein